MKNTKVDDKFLERWRWSPDRAENSVSIGMFGIDATISTKNEVAFAIRASVNGSRVRKTIGYFRPGYFTIAEAVKGGQKQLDDWRAEERGERPTLADSQVPRLFELIALYAVARTEGDPDACPNDKGLPKRWEGYAELFPKVYETLWKTKVNVIQRHSMLAAHKAYLDKRKRETGKVPHTTVRFVFNAIKPVLKFAQLRYGMPLDALMRVQHVGPKEEKRQRIVLPREWQLIAPVLNAMHKETGILPRFLLATACRLSMATTMRWRDLSTINIGADEELAVWCVPAENMKMGNVAMFPIVGESARLIAQLRAMAGGKPAKDAFVFPENVRKAWENNPDKWQKDIFEASGTKGWHRHDLRRTASTLLKFVGADEKTVKRLLAHEDQNKSATDGYLSLKGNVEALTKLATQLQKVHALLNDIEAGRVTGELRRLYRELQADMDLKKWMQGKGMDYDALIEVEPSKDAPRAEVRELRAAK